MRKTLIHCDVCGKVTETEDLYDLHLSHAFNFADADADAGLEVEICDNCADILLDWLGKPEGGISNG